MYRLSEMEAQITQNRTGPWTQQEHARFMEGVKIHGKDWTKIVSHVPTRTGTQIRSHAQKFFNKLEYSFESRAILGDQSQVIMGPPENENQYALYKQVGKLLLKAWKNGIVFCHALYDYFEGYNLVSKRRGPKQNLDRVQPLEKRISKKARDLAGFDQDSSGPISSEHQQLDSSCRPIFRKRQSSFFYQIISSDQRQLTVQQSIKNFMKLYVDFKPVSPRKSSRNSVENSLTAHQQHKNSFHSSEQEETFGALKIKNVGIEVAMFFPSGSQ